MASDTSKIDELLRKAKLVTERSGGGAAVSTAPPGSVIGNTATDIKEAVENLKAIRATTEEAKGFIELVKQSWFATWRFINKLWPVRAYKWVEEKLTTKQDKETGERKVTRPKLRLGMRLASIFMLSAMVPGMVGVPARNVDEFVVDTGRMTGAMHTEVVRLNDAKNTADHNAWAVTGMRFRNGGEESTIFKIKTSIANDLWHMIHNHTIAPFYPDDVVAPVAPGANDLYRVTYYGNRWRVNDWIQAFPELLSVQKLTPAEVAAFNTAAAQNHMPVTTPSAKTLHDAPVAPAPAGPTR